MTGDMKVHTAVCLTVKECVRMICIQSTHDMVDICSGSFRLERTSTGCTRLQLSLLADDFWPLLVKVLRDAANLLDDAWVLQTVQD